MWTLFLKIIHRACKHNKRPPSLCLLVVVEDGEWYHVFAGGDVEGGRGGKKGLEVLLWLWVCCTMLLLDRNTRARQKHYFKDDSASSCKNSKSHSHPARLCSSLPFSGTLSEVRHILCATRRRCTRLQNVKQRFNPRSPPPPQVSQSFCKVKDMGLVNLISEVSCVSSSAIFPHLRPSLPCNVTVWCCCSKWQVFHRPVIEGSGVVWQIM